jgi:hypothetical protein
VVLRHLEPDRDSVRVAPERRTLKAKLIQESDHVVDVPNDLIGVSPSRTVASPVASVIKEDAPIGPGKRLEIAGSAPELRIAASPKVQDERRAIALDRVVKARTIRCR